MIRLLMIFALSASLSACVSILPDPAPAPSVYRLATSSNAVAAGPNAEIVRIDRPSATQIFNSSDIVVTEDGQKLSAVAQAKWSEATPIIIQNAMIDALEGSSQFVGLVPTSGARTKTRLHPINVSSIVAAIEDANDAAMSNIVSWLESQKGNRAS